MRIFLFFFVTCILFLSKSYGQINPSDKEIMDSLLRNDAMLQMIDNYNKPSSYFRVNIGFGNKLYSNQNKAVESLQNNSRFVIAPSASYYHKSGFGLTFTSFLFNENNKTQFYQSTITPSFIYTKGGIADVSLSYTHYFIKDMYIANVSPVQNEFYGSIVFKKPWLKPGVALGYSSGTYHEIIKIDTIIRIVQQRHIKFTDTLSTKLSSFSFSGTVEHSFIFPVIFSKNDGISFIPQFSLITGINNYKVSHSSSTENYAMFTKKLTKKIRHFDGQSKNGDFQLQSLGLDLDFNYFIGKFYFEPELYFDYYLPDTKDKRLTQIFNFNIGITF